MSGDLTARDDLVQQLANVLFEESKTCMGSVEERRIARVMLAALAAAGWELKRKPDPLIDLRSDEGYYLGKQGTTHEHRTVGTYRAWCYDANEWCYPHDPCRLCKEMADFQQEPQ